MKNMMAKKALLHYPDFKLDFDVYTDTSNYQLGAVIVQENGPVTFYSRKLTPAQMNYTVMEKELLSIIETCVHFRNFLLGFKIHIFRSQKLIFR